MILVTGKSVNVSQGHLASYHQIFSLGNNDKARKELKWLPTTALRESIYQQYEWVKEWQK